MTWHAQEITLILRRYEAGQNYEARDPFTSVAVVQILGEGRARVSGFLSGSGAALGRSDWLELAALLRDRYGIEHIESERHGEAKVHDTGPAPLG